MEKQEFMEELRLALGGGLNATAVAEHMNYYQDYINMEIRKGRSEADVMESLGDPRLIARTILDTSEGVVLQDGSRSEFERDDDGQDGDYVPVRRTLHLPGWLWVVIVIGVVGLLISVFFSILSFLLPVLIPILFVSLMIKLFRDWLN